MSGLLVAVVVIIGAIGGFLYLAFGSTPKRGVADSSPMPVALRRILVVYLLAIGSCLIYMLTSLSSADFPESPVQLEPFPVSAAAPATPAPAAGGTQAPAATTEPRVPTLLQVFPQSTLGSTPTTFLTLYGHDFTAESKVRFNMRERAVKPPVTPDLITAQLEPADLVGFGSIAVDVVNPGNRVSTAITVSVTRPRVPLNVFGYRPAITREVQLLLLVICAGALGSYVHALKSLADFTGNGTLTASWFSWYITRPFLGMAMAVIFYALLRGGFLAGTPADARIVNPFGVIAVAALVGMFADKASQKLAEIFDTLFKSDDTRSGKLTAPVIRNLDPDTIPVGTATPFDLQIMGDRLGKVSVVRLNAVERKPDQVTEKQITLKLQSQDVATPGEIKVTVVDQTGADSTSAILRITDLKIAKDPLPDATAGTAYDRLLSASGGSPPCKWTLTNAPPWLKMNEKTGQLSGKPPAPGTVKILAVVTDANGASVSESFDLKIG